MAKKIVLHPETKLERHVYSWAKRQAVDYDDGLAGVFRDLFYGGCQSGFVGHLIYYHDTVRFYKRYLDDINRLVSEYVYSGGNMADLPGWDNEDPLALDVYNQNFLAWFGFEQAADNLWYREDDNLGG